MTLGVTLPGRTNYRSLYPPPYNTGKSGMHSKNEVCWIFFCGTLAGAFHVGRTSAVGVVRGRASACRASTAPGARFRSADIIPL